ncbi:MAG: hypothetical protein KF819_29745 [Labilithrix sp.]|nr:hypothetical protein [Labilithrix sp.]
MSAYTELLAIMPGFVVVNMALIHLTSAYAATGASMHAAQTGAWTPAMTGCNGSSSPAGGAQTSAGANDGSLEPLSPRVKKVTAHAGSPALRAPIQTTSLRTTDASSRTRGLAGSNAWATFDSADYARETRVMCNEVPKAIQDKDEKSAVDDAWKRFVK